MRLILEFFRPLLEFLRPLGPVALGFGGILVAIAITWLVVTEWRRASGIEPNSDGPQVAFDPAWTWLVPLALALVVGAVLRLLDLDAKTLTHPEAYNPGIPLPAVISYPPPRLSFAETLSWHFHREPHPLGYYLAVWGWTKFFGTSLATIRLPSALLGIASILLVFRVGSLAYDRVVGWIAAGLLALHGLHIYWSQTARMYVPGCFMGLVATWLLLEILRTRRPSGVLEAAYVTAIVAGLLTQWFFWPLLGAHVLWSLLNHAATTRRISRLLYFQTLAMVLGSHTLSHAINSAGRVGSGSGPSLDFLRDFFSFGFLFEPDIYSEPMRALPTWAALGVLAFALVLLMRGLAERPAAVCPADERLVPSPWPLALAAIGMSMFMIGLALLAHVSIKYVGPISSFPMLWLGILPVAAVLGPRLHAWLAPLEARLAPVASLTSPVLILTLVPTLTIFVVSFLKPLIAARALLIFVPYLLIWIAAGARSLGRRTLIKVPLTLALVTLFVASTLYFRTTPSSARDYQSIARATQERLAPDDLIFVRSADWRTTPVFYYLDASLLVAGDYATSVAERPGARVWVLLFDPQQPTDEMTQALNDFRIVEEVTALRARSRLYVRKPAAR